MTGPIYEPSGRAREYADLALNLFEGCPHRCAYCYGPQILHCDRETFHTNVGPRKNILSNLAYQLDLEEQNFIGKRVLLCFTCDPCADGNNVTIRQAIQLLHDHDVGVTILTKAGQRSFWTFDFLGELDTYAASLTLLNATDSALWEPKAAPPLERINGLYTAHAKGIETWASFEPVIHPDVTLALLDLVLPYIDGAKAGPLNYAGRLPAHLRAKLQGNVNWADFAEEFEDRCHIAGVECLLKQDLIKLAHGVSA